MKNVATIKKSPTILEYTLAYFALLLLLASTVIAARFDLGSASMAIAMLIAGFKAVIILLYFMHLRHSALLRGLVAALLVFVVIVVALAVTDYGTRHGVV